MCVCVCVCVCEREREGESNRKNIFLSMVMCNVIDSSNINNDVI